MIALVIISFWVLCLRQKPKAWRIQLPSSTISGLCRKPTHPALRLSTKNFSNTMHSINDTDISRLSHRSLRYSCDRCHTQKLRCRHSVIEEHSSEHDSCLRCRKAGIKCTFSPRGRVGRPPKTTKQAQEAESMCRTSQPRSSSTTNLKPTINKTTHNTGYDHIYKADGRQPEDWNTTLDLGGLSAVNVSVVPYRCRSSLINSVFLRRSDRRLQY